MALRLLIPAPSRRRALALAVLGAATLLAACGPGGDLPRCGSDAACAPGTVCERPVASEAGVCIAPYALALSSPAPGSWVGAAGAAVRATLRVQASGRSEPAAIDLLAGGAPAAVLARTGPGTYEGSWVPAPGSPGSASLVAVASLGMRDETAAAPVAVLVDADPPALSASAGCGAACQRDSVLALRATASDANLAGVTAALDLDPARPVALALVGAEWQADVDLGAWPFPALARDVSVTIRARDLAGNEAAASLPTPVTRVRWAYDAGAPVTSPAVMADGTLVAGVSTTAGQLLALRPDGTRAWSSTVGTGFVTAAPSIGPGAIWVGSQDGRVYAVALDGSAVLNGSGCNTGGTIQGTPALASGPTEVAFVASGVGRVFGVSTAPLCAAGPLTDTFTAATSIDRSGKVLAATATATLRKYTFDGAAFTADWSTLVGVNVSAPLALDAFDDAWTGSQDARLDATTPAGATTTVKTLGGSIIDSPLVVAGGDVVVGDQARVLHRFHPDGTSAWAVEPVLDGPVLAPLALAGGSTALLVPTAAGTLHAVAADGTVQWSGALTQGQALRAGNIRTAAGAALGTAYFGSADGKIYAVAIEGRLDEAAPWPKAHRDTRNTSRASGPLP